MDQFYTTAQVADCFQISRAVVVRWIRGGKIDGFQLPGGKGYRIPREAIERLRLANEAPSVPAKA